MAERLRFNTQCIGCILNKAIDRAPDDISEKQRLTFAKGVLKIMAEADDSVSAPELVATVTEYKNKNFGFSDDYKDIKVHFNALMLSLEDTLRERIEKSDDTLYQAIRFAMLGNYIDFGAMYEVNEETLKESFSSADDLGIGEEEYKNFVADLKTAENLVYLTDNCGEIVADKLLINEIKKQFPDIKVNILVRGSAVLNDATLDDAYQVGLEKVAPVTPNGNSIAGTCIGKLSVKAQELLDNADVIISKGQGNFETLNGCGRNIYYLFLCKCSLFAKRFCVPTLTGMFLNDKRM